MFRISWCLFLLVMLSLRAVAQDPALNIDSLRQIYFLPAMADTAAVPPVAIDTITPSQLRPLDSVSLASITAPRKLGYEIMDVKKLTDDFLRQSISYDPHLPGEPLPRGERWVLLFIAGLLVVFAALKRLFDRQLHTIVLSFFSNRILGNLNKEDNLFTSWPFLLLFVQFGFIIGMFFFLVAQWRELPSIREGFKFFLSISGGIVLLYGLKIILLRLLGFVFNVQKPVGEYVSILYLSYFNAALLFMPLVLAFALSPMKYAPYYVGLALILLVLIFVFQFIRAGVIILSGYRFSKFYLFLYFCTLEICPILILIKAIGF